VCVCALNISHGGLNVRLFADYLSTLDIVHDVDWRPFGIVVQGRWDAHRLCDSSEPSFQTSKGGLIW
jgi:hypothetical protein